MEFKFDGDKVFFTSDTHFNHANIIKFCERPFGSIEEMNEALIANWNRVVGKDDIVFHLGDFCFGGSEAWNSILEKATNLGVEILNEEQFLKLIGK